MDSVSEQVDRVPDAASLSGPWQHKKTPICALHHRQDGSVIELSDASTTGWLKFDIHVERERARKTYICWAGEGFTCSASELASAGTDELAQLRAGCGTEFRLGSTLGLQNWKPESQLKNSTMTIEHVHEEGDANRLILDNRGFVYFGGARGIVVHDGHIQNLPMAEARAVAAEARHVKRDIQQMQQEAIVSSKEAKDSRKQISKPSPLPVLDRVTDLQRYEALVQNMRRQNNGLMPRIDAVRQMELNGGYRNKLVREHHITDEWQGVDDVREWSQLVSKTPSRLVQTRLTCHAWTMNNGHEVDCGCDHCKRYVRTVKEDQDICRKAEERIQKRREQNERRVVSEMAYKGMLKYMQVQKTQIHAGASECLQSVSSIELISRMNRQSGRGAVFHTTISALTQIS